MFLFCRVESRQNIIKGIFALVNGSSESNF